MVCSLALRLLETTESAGQSAPHQMTRDCCPAFRHWRDLVSTLLIEHLLIQGLALDPAIASWVQDQDSFRNVGVTEQAHELVARRNAEIAGLCTVGQRQRSAHSAFDSDDRVGRCSAARFKRPSESAGPVTNRRPKTSLRRRPRQPGGKLNAQLNVVRHELSRWV